VSAEPTMKTDRKPVNLVESSEENPDASAMNPTPRTKDRLKAWEEGSSTKVETGDRRPIKVAEDEDVAAVKERLNKWSEVTKEPAQSPSRKEPIKIYDDDETPQ